MRKRGYTPSIRLIIAAACAATAPMAVAPTASAIEPPPLVAIHDAPKGSDSGAVSFLHPETYAVLATVEVEGDPWPLGYDPSGARYFVLGATPRSGWTGKASGPWRLVAVDRASSTSAIVGEVGLPPVATMIDPDRSRLYTLGRGGKNESDVVGVFDLARRTTLARLPTAPGAVDWERTATGQRLYVLHGGDPPGKKQPASKLIGIDTEALKIVTDVALPSRAVSVLAADEGSLVYVLCRGGKPKEGPKAQGKLVVVDGAAGTVLARLDVGFEARSLRVDPRSRRVYVLGDDPTGGATTLTIARGSEALGRVTLPVASGGLRLGPDADRLYVVGDKAVIEVDPAGAKVSRTWPLDFDPAHVFFDAARDRAFVTPALGLKVAELGLDDGRVHMALTTGRTGTKVGKAIGWALLGAVERSGTAFQLGPDGRFLYVINAQTDDLTIIDTLEHVVVAIIPTGGGTRAITTPAGASTIYVESKDHLARIDTATNKLVQEIPIAAEGQPRGAVTVDSAGGRLFVARGTTVDVIDFATGQRRGSVVLPRPVSVVSVPASRDSEDETPEASDDEVAPVSDEEPAGR